MYYSNLSVKLRYSIITDSVEGMTTSTKSSQEITQALADNYLGVGSTPEGALAALTDDLLANRLHADDLGATHLEMMNAIGKILLEIMERSLA